MNYSGYKLTINKNTLCIISRPPITSVVIGGIEIIHYINITLYAYNNILQKSVLLNFVL